MVYLTCFLIVLSCFMVAHAEYVVAHFMVGNTYPYSVADWSRNIELAAGKGLDGFVLNLGRDSWQPDRVADAFAAARDFGSDFKLFLSFDMTSLPCVSASDAEALMRYIINYYGHPNSLFYNGKMFVSTFAGQDCHFGESSLDDGWIKAVKSGPPVYFVPSFFVDPSAFNGIRVMDGAFNWNSGWPMGNYDINFDSDNDYLRNLQGRSYMAAVSPWFFTHYGPDTYNKNFVYRADNWLFAERWEMLVQNRKSIDIAQVITWNDYGESHYVGPIAGEQPHSEAWTNGFKHEDWLDLMKYYIEAFRNGEYSEITDDRIFLWGRLYPVNAEAPDGIGRPSHSEWVEDFLWAVVFLKSQAEVTLSCGPSVETTSLPGGASKLKLALISECNVAAKIDRDGEEMLRFEPAGFRFTADPPSYNFNAFVAASPLPLSPTSL